MVGLMPEWLAPTIREIRDRFEKLKTPNVSTTPERKYSWSKKRELTNRQKAMAFAKIVEIHPK